MSKVVAVRTKRYQIRQLGCFGFLALGKGIKVMGLHNALSVMKATGSTGIVVPFFRG